MTTRNDHPVGQVRSDWSEGDILDELLAALKEDMGGARTAAIGRAFASGVPSTNGSQPGEHGSNGTSVEPYTDELERFFGAKHSPSTDLAEIERAITSAARVVNELKSDVSDLAETNEEFDDRMERLEANVSTISGRLDDLETSVANGRGDSSAASGRADVETLAKQFKNSITQLEADDDVLRLRLDGLKKNLDDRIDTLDARLKRQTASLESAIESLENASANGDSDHEAELESMRKTFTEAIRKLHREVHDEVDGLEADVEAIKRAMGAARERRGSL